MRIYLDVWLARSVNGPGTSPGQAYPTQPHALLRRLTVVHVGLNLIYLVPGETGGTETVAAGLLPELVRCGSGVTFTAFINRETERSRRSLRWLDDVQTVT